MKAWLKGGLIGLGIDVIILVIYISGSRLGYIYDEFGIGFCFTQFIIPCYFLRYQFGFYLAVIFGVIIWFLIGALVGLILSKKVLVRGFKIGGLICGVLALLLFILMMIGGIRREGLKFFFSPDYIWNFIGYWIFVLIILICGGLIGTFIGWIVGKIKSRKQGQIQEVKVR